MSLITVASFSKPEDAHLLRMRLEAGDVPAFIQDENLVQLDWMYSNAIGGVRVQIWEEDVERAHEILDEEPEEATPADWPHCPRCDSVETAPDEVPRRVSYLMVLLAHFPFVYARNQWKCRECANVWKA